MAWFDRLAVEGDQKEGVSVDEDSYRAGSSATGVGQPESVTPSREHGELGQRNPGSVRLPSSSVHQKDGRFRVAVRERDLARVLPLAHQNHVARVVDVVQCPVRIPYVRLLHYQRPEYAIRDVVPCKSRSIHSTGRIYSYSNNFGNNSVVEKHVQSSLLKKGCMFFLACATFMHYESIVISVSGDVMNERM